MTDQTNSPQVFSEITNEVSASFCHRCGQPIPLGATICPACRTPRLVEKKPTNVPIIAIVLIVCTFILILLAGILAAIAIPAYHDYTVRAKASNVNVATASAPQASASATAQIAQTDQTATLARVFNGAMLGVNQRYFESMAGIPQSSGENEHTFIVQGCTVIAHISDGTVYALSLDITPECQPDLTSFIGSFAPDLGQPLTFGAFEQSANGGSSLSYYADCLGLCGNAYDPSVYGYWEGPRAIQNMKVVLEVQLVDGPAIDASFAWARHMINNMGEDWVIATKFNCSNQFEQTASDAFQNILATKVTIGSDVTIPVSCD